MIADDSTFFCLFSYIFIRYVRSLVQFLHSRVFIFTWLLLIALEGTEQHNRPVVSINELKAARQGNFKTKGKSAKGTPYGAPTSLEACAV